MKKEILSNNSQNVWQLIVSLLLIFCGVYVLFNPMAALITSAFILGLFFIFMGGGYLMAFRVSRSYMLMTVGILDILIGIFFIGNLEVSALSMSIIFALWCLFTGILQTTASFELKDMGIEASKWLFLSGLLGILFAILIFFYPAIGIFTITFLMGFYLIIYGFFELMRYMQGF